MERRRRIIEGSITFDASIALRTTGESINPVDKAKVTLYNSNGVKLATTTSPLGKYQFTEAIAGDYTVKVEYPGGKTPSGAIAVTTDSEVETVSKANTVVLREVVTTDICS